VDDLKKRILILIVVRLVLVFLVLGFAIIAIPRQVSFFESLQPFILAVLFLSVAYVLVWKYTDRSNLLYQVQFVFDLILISALIIVTGGINSLFRPFYVLIIVYASLLKHREGGIIALTSSITSYSAIVHLGYLGWVPGAQNIGSYSQLVYQISLDTLGFMGVATLGIYLSERLQTAHRELGAERVVHRNIVDSIRDGLITLDTTGEVTSCNRAVTVISGYTQDELLERSAAEVFSTSILDTILENDFAQDPRALHMECWARNKKQEPLFVGLSCSPLHSHEQEQIGYILSFQDLTEIKKREDEVQFKEKMAAIGEVAAGLAHEIRNPLGSLSGSIQVLESELQLSDQKKRLVNIVLRECSRLNKIVGDFLLYAGQRPLNPKPVDLLPLVADTVEIFKNSPEFRESHNIQVIPSPGSLCCMGDSDQFRQVIWNILQNGIRSMPEGGELVVRLECEDSRARITFRDEGVGMNPEVQKKLFQPFERGFRNGVGLGMAIVYQIIQEHHGTIDVLSSPESGTLIDISFPLEH